MYFLRLYTRTERDDEFAPDGKLPFPWKKLKFTALLDARRRADRIAEGSPIAIVIEVVEKKTDRIKYRAERDSIGNVTRTPLV